MRPPAHHGDAVAWTGHARLSTDVVAPLAITLVVLVGHAFAMSLYADAATGLWARRFERRYVLRPGAALRLRQPEPHLPAITVSVDHAEQGAAVAARHLADRARRD